MPSYQVKIEVSPKEGMPDPKSFDESRRLHALFPDADVSEVQISKLIGFVVEVADPQAAEVVTRELADKILVQPVLENYTIESIEPVDGIAS